MELEEQATGIAQNGANLIPSPQWCRRGRAVLTYGLYGPTVMISKCCHGSEAIRDKGSSGQNIKKTMIMIVIVITMVIVAIRRYDRG